MLILDTGQNFPLSWQGWGLLLALSIVCQVLGQGLTIVLSGISFASERRSALQDACS